MSNWGFLGDFERSVCVGNFYFPASLPFGREFCNRENSHRDAFGSTDYPVLSVRQAREPPKSTPGAAVLYMRARRRRRCPHARARETRNKTHHGPPVAPPARAWRVLFRVSRAREPMYPRCRGLRGRASHPKVSFLAVCGVSPLRLWGPPGWPGGRRPPGGSQPGMPASRAFRPKVYTTVHHCEIHHPCIFGCYTSFLRWR